MRQYKCATTLTLLTLVSMPDAFAAGYKINEQSGSGMGNAFAGSAAYAEDASILFHNPAAMTSLDRPQVSGGFSYINIDVQFSGSATNAAGQPIAIGDTYSNGGDFIPDVLIPYLYYVNPINEKIAVGIGLFSPFGADSDYDDNFIGGAFADTTSLLSLNLQPTVAYKINDALSIGLGLNVLYMEGELSRQLDLIPVEQLSPGFENTATVTGDDIGFGWNLGIHYQLTESTSIGFAYRSEIEMNLEGSSSFAKKEGVQVFDPTLNNNQGGLQALPTINDESAKLAITTPESYTLSIASKVTPKIQLLAGVTRTGWSSFEYLDIYSNENTPGIQVSLAAQSGLGAQGLSQGVLSHNVQKWDDSLSGAIGVNYLFNEQLILRAGYVYDESPTTDQFRTARVPDSDRQWFTLGATYKTSNDLSFDFGAAYLLIDDAAINEFKYDLNDQPKGATNLNGNYSLDAFGFTFGANYKM